MEKVSCRGRDDQAVLLEQAQYSQALHRGSIAGLSW